MIKHMCAHAFTTCVHMKNCMCTHDRLYVCTRVLARVHMLHQLVYVSISRGAKRTYFSYLHKNIRSRNNIRSHVKITNKQTCSYRLYFVCLVLRGLVLVLRGLVLVFVFLRNRVLERTCVGRRGFFSGGVVAGGSRRFLRSPCC